MQLDNKLIYAIVIAVIVQSVQTVAESVDDSRNNTIISTATAATYQNIIRNNKRTNVTDAVSSNEKAQQSSTTTQTPSQVNDVDVPASAVAVDLVQQENENLTNDTFDEKSTAKRTINYSNHKFNAPIVVEEVRDSDDSGDNLFTPADSRKQINVQILDPESHNNGQFLKETVFERTTNSATITSTTTTERTSSLNGLRRGGAAAPSKFLAPIQAGLRLSNDERKATDDCDDDVVGKIRTSTAAAQPARNNDYVEVQKISKTVSYVSPQPRKGNIFGSRFSTTTKPPCNQALPCSTQRPLYTTARARQQQNVAVSTVRPYTTAQPLARPTVQPLQNVHTIQQIVPTVQTVQTVQPVVHQRVQTVQTVQPVVHQRVQTLQQVQSVQAYHEVHTPVATVQPVHAVATVVTTPRTHVIHQPHVVHTHHEVPVERTHVVQQPVIVQQQVPVEKIVDRPVAVPVDRIVKQFVHVPVEVEKLVVKEVPVDRIVEKHVDRPVPYEVERIVEKLVHVPYEKIVDRPVEVEKIVEKQVPVDRYVDRYIDRPVPYEVGVPVYVQVPIHIPHAVHVPFPYLVKPLPPPPPKHYFITKTTKYTKGHLGLFDFKHNHKHTHVKHVYVKTPPPNIIHEELISHPSDFVESLGLSPPSTYGLHPAASINVFKSVLPNHQLIGSPSLHNTYGSFNTKFNYIDDVFGKGIRWEYGFKPPLIPSLEIDEFGNPKNC